MRQGDVQELGQPIRFGMHNIRNIWNRKLSSALIRMEQGGVDIGVLQETKVTRGRVCAGVKRLSRRGDKGTMPVLQ